MGIDFGKINDSTVLTCLEKCEDGKLIMRYLKEYRGDYNNQLNGKKNSIGIIRLIELINPAQVLVDATGAGEKLYEDMKRVFGSKIRGIKFTNTGKERMVTDLHIAFEDKRLRIMNDDKLIQELHNLERKSIAGSKRVRYEHPKGKHDDYVWSLALAIMGVSRKTISFHVSSA